MSAAKFTSRAWYLVVCVLGWFYEVSIIEIKVLMETSNSNIFLWVLNLAAG